MSGTGCGHACKGGIGGMYGAGREPWQGPGRSVLAVWCHDPNSSASVAWREAAGNRCGRAIAACSSFAQAKRKKKETGGNKA